MANFTVQEVFVCQILDLSGFEDEFVKHSKGCNAKVFLNAGGHLLPITWSLLVDYVTNQHAAFDVHNVGGFGLVFTPKTPDFGQY